MPDRDATQPADEALLDELLARLVADIGAGRTLDAADLLPERPDLREQVAATVALAQTIAVRRPARLPAFPGYEVVGEIGRGGMGAVYLVRDPKLSRTVALKTLTAARVVGEAGRERFAREVKAIARLSHPSIVKVHDAGAVEDVPFYTMEHVPGCSLAEVVRRLRESGKQAGELRGRDLAAAVLGAEAEAVPAGWQNTYVEAACRLIAEVGDALQHAHEHGVVHRDVKPSNVLVRRDGHALLFDFGLARLDDELSLTRSGDFVGTPYYASPEQLDRRKQSIDARTDVYSLGVTLYELLTLQVPFAGESTHEVLRKILSEEVPAARKANASIPRDLETICTTALEKDRERRYPSASELAADLRRLLAFEPIHARPAGAWTRTVRLVQRNKAASAAAALGFLLCVGTPLALWQQQRSANAAITKEIGKLEQINQFLAVMFEAIDPANAGHEAKVVDVLDPAVEKLDAQFAKDDEVALPLREAIAGAYHAIGLFAKAEEQFAILADVHAHRSGSESRQALEMRLRVLKCKREQGAVQELVEQVARLAATAGERLGEADPLTLDARCERCRLMLLQSQVDQVEPLMRAVVDDCLEYLGPQDITTLEARGMLAHLFYLTSRNEEARTIDTDLVGLYEQRFSPDHPETLTLRNNLAAVLTRLARFDEAEVHLRSILDRRQAKYSPTHPLVIMSLTALAEFHRDKATCGGAVNVAERRGLCERALALLDQAELAARDLVETHEIRRDILYKRGRILIGLQRYAEAEKVLREQARLLESLLGPDNLETLSARYALVRAMHGGATSPKSDPGKLAETEQEYRALLAHTRSALGEDSIATWQMQDGLAECLIDLDRLDEAERLLQEALHHHTQLGGPDSRSGAYTKGLLSRLEEARTKPK